MSIHARKKDIELLGYTSRLTDVTAEEGLGTDMMWSYVFENVDDLIIRTLDKNPAITQYYDKYLMARIAIARIGDPKIAIAFKIKRKDYYLSNFYTNFIKPTTHGN
jgi:hypothetical protein